MFIVCYAGIVMGVIVDRYLPVEPSLRLHLSGVATGCVVGYGMYGVMLVLGLNPKWSISLALKHCANRAWIHLDMTPFFALIKDLASLLGKDTLHSCYMFMHSQYEFPGDPEAMHQWHTMPDQGSHS